MRRISKSYHDLYLFERDRFDGAFVDAGAAIDTSICDKCFAVFHYDCFSRAGTYACFAADTFFAVYFSGHILSFHLIGLSRNLVSVSIFSNFF